MAFAIGLAQRKNLKKFELFAFGAVKKFGSQCRELSVFEIFFSIMSYIEKAVSGFLKRLFRFTFLLKNVL